MIVKAREPSSLCRYNTILRGRDIKYVDYIAVGKGRDMSMETICTFEAKVGTRGLQGCLAGH